jgi:hypothetical protein
MSAALGMGDALVIHPEQVLQSEVAYKIMSYGMRNGSFTGKKLGDYINNSVCDYKNARRIINGLDRADLIKGYAEKLENYKQPYGGQHPGGWPVAEKLFS